MHDARLYVDGQEADFYKSEELAPRITRQIFDLSQLSGSAGDYTLSLVLPDTARNDLLFGWPGDLQAKQPFFGQGQRNAVIEVDGQVVLKGSLTIDSREAKGYGATILGLTVAWAELLAARHLRDLATFPRWLWTGIRSSAFAPWPEHVSGSVGLKDVWPTFEGDGYEMQFPLIGYGNFDSDPTNDATLNPINGLELVKASGGIVDGALIYNQSFPSEWPFDQFIFRGGAYVRDIMRRIFLEAGYRVGGTWYDDPANKNLFVPFTDSGDAEPEWNWGTLAMMKANTSGVRHYMIHGPSIDLGYPFVPPLTFQDWFVDMNEFLPDAGGEQQRIFTTLAYFMQFDEVRYDYSFANIGDVYLAQVDGFVDYDATVNMGGFWVAVTQYIDGNNVGVDDLVPRIQGEQMGRALIMLLRNPPESDENLWKGIDDNYLRDGGTITNPDILDYVDLDVMAAGFPKDFQTVSNEHKGFFYWLSAADPSGTLTLSAKGVPVSALDRLCVCILMRNYVAVQDAFPGTPPNPERAYYFYQEIVNVSGSVVVSNIRRPDGTPYETHLTAARLLPDMGQVDFVKSFIAQNNLYVAVNERSRLVTLNYPGTFFLPGEAAVDWSDKVDMSEAAITPACRYKRFVFEMEQEDGEALLDWTKYRHVVENRGRNATDDFEAKLAFAPTAARTYVWVQFNRVRLSLPCLNTAEELAKLLGDLGSGQEQPKVSYKPRLLRWEGFTNLPDRAAPFAVGAIPPAAWAPFLPVNAYCFPMNNRNDQNFPLAPGETWYPKASVLPGFIWPGTGGLYETYYADSVRALVEAIQAVVMAMLRPADMQALDQRRPVVADGILYTLNKVEDYNPVVPQRTKCTLIRRY